MKKGLTEIVFILDKSGSMSGLEADTIGGYNSFLERQKKEEGEAYVSTVLFSDRSAVIHDRVPIEKIEPMTDKQYYVDGCTALLDAMGGATIFVITTDGQENASSEYSYEKIQKMVKRQTEKYGWEFIFLGANIDAFSEAERLGICRDRAVRYECDAVGTALNFSVLSETICDVRRGKKMKKNWNAEITEHYNKTN